MMTEVASSAAIKLDTNNNSISNDFAYITRERWLVGIVQVISESVSNPNKI